MLINFTFELTENVNHNEVIAVHQGPLESIAYKILGCKADAEDAVHDTFVKWLSIDHEKIENTKAYLFKMVTNISLNIVKSRRKTEQLAIEDYQEVLEDNEKSERFFNFDMDEQLAEAWGFVNRKLEPMEQAIYILREMFNVEYEDLQLIFDKKAENCRKIVSRAKEKLRNSELPKFQYSIPQIHILDNIKLASKYGQLTQLISSFTSEGFFKKN